jgi:hypothetical protein
VKLIVKLIYKPFSIVGGLLAGAVARRIFDVVWSHIDDEPPPKANTDDETWGRVLGAAALKSVTFSVTRATADRASAQTFRYLFGVWPGRTRD